MTGQQLKNSILQMAVQGKLVPQDPNDEPASVLLERIRKEKEQLIKEGKIKKEKNPSVIFRGADNLPYEKVGKNEPVCIADEVPFDIPDSWEWVRLGSIASVLGGKRIPSGRKLSQNNTGYVYIRVSDMKNNSVKTDSLLYVPQDIYPSISKYIINKEDVYITVAGTIGSVGKIPPELDGANLTENADRIVFRIINQDWLIQYLSSSVVQNQIAEATTKVGQPKLAIKRIEDFLVALPPVAEQHRIVEKIKQIESYLNDYSSTGNELEELNNEFPILLKKSILQEAVQGKLVSQDPNDEPASVLLERIRAEKQRLIKEGKIKKDKHESVIFRRDNSHYEKLDGIERCIDDEIPFEIPDSWCWVRLGVISTYAHAKKKLNAQLADKNIWSLDLEDIEKGGRIIKRITVGERKPNGEKTVFSTGDVLYSKLRPYLLKILVAPDNGICTSEIVPFSLYGDINAEYIVTYLKSPYVDNLINSITYGIKMPRVGTNTMISLLVPIPPFNEQQRIVHIIEELLPLIEKV